MNENEQEVIDSTNDTETTENQEEVVIEETTEETQEQGNETEQTDVADLKKKIATLEAQKEHWRGKAATDKVVKTDSKPAKSELAPSDLIALMSNQVIEAEDINEVIAYANFKKISVADALKSAAVKATLQEKNEYRKVAQATNSGTVRRGTSKVSDETLIEKARKGDLPDSDADIQRLVNARYAKK